MPASTLTRKGQVTVPKAIRESLGVRPGDRVHFRLTEAGDVLVEAATIDLRQLRGLLRAPPDRKLSLEQMDEAIRRAAVRE